jgi:hypothetical protein
MPEGILSQSFKNSTPSRGDFTKAALNAGVIGIAGLAGA